MPLFGWPPVELDGRVAASIVFLGLAGTGLAYVLYFGLIAGVGATAASSVSYVVPVFAVLVSTVLLGEPVTVNLLLGGATVLTGPAYAEGRLGRRGPASRPPVTAPSRTEGC